MGEHQERAERALRLAEEVGAEALLVLSAPNRRYLTGFSGSAGVVLLTPRRRWLLTDSRYLEQAEREAPDYEVRALARQVFRQVADLLREEGASQAAFEADKWSVSQWRRATAEAPEVRWIESEGLVERLRVVKSESELAVMAQAAHIADEALAQVALILRPGLRERDVAVHLECKMRQLGAEGLAFPTIVASGPRGSLPHGQASERVLEAGELVTIDFGATFGGYHSDQTVTWALAGDRPERARLREVYEVVRAAQAAGLAAVRPGVRASEVDRAARSVIEAAGYGEAFGHSTGHGVGLEVHEAPWAAKAPATDWELQPNMVVTVEPGIYLPGLGGVRLEDTVVVTPDGFRRLTWADKGWREW
ncbi:MAG: aminopeptidase P family protein [Firmicutes bacterium]|nr:aminopeptidase P family protein [Bacillota bacterium]